MRRKKFKPSKFGTFVDKRFLSWFANLSDLPVSVANTISALRLVLLLLLLFPPLCTSLKAILVSFYICIYIIIFREKKKTFNLNTSPALVDLKKLVQVRINFPRILLRNIRRLQRQEKHSERRKEREKRDSLWRNNWSSRGEKEGSHFQKWAEPTKPSPRDTCLAVGFPGEKWHG